MKIILEYFDKNNVSTVNHIHCEHNKLNVTPNFMIND